MTQHKRMVCIHGHFYQPPRENPWLDDIEREPSAAPHHNWNSRIAEECYAPNAWARILSGDGRVSRLYDNYARLSFNVGPTLASWLAKHTPETLDAMIAADRESLARLGHGNAIAQVYNHVILPLANKRDKYTQVRWGMRAFRRTFGRQAEGIWLAETAVDAETLDVLADEGVKFTILSPYQAARFRVQGGDWIDAEGGSIPSGRAYSYTCKSGKKIALFFYDGAIARGIAFERLLGDAGQLVASLMRAHSGPAVPAGEPWLVHTATDGESYGHHFRFGDMALAAAFARLDHDSDIEVVNYGAFLGRYGCGGDVELLPVSAWSCAHGVGRWERDCGCRMANEPGWNQRWRAGLRTGLNGLRDGLVPLYEYKAGAFLRDPWAARDDYVDVFDDVAADGARVDVFFAKHQREPMGPELRHKALVLLEMQRCAQFMFTSCGWFFDDVAGPEAAILMRYAARAVALAKEIDVEEGTRLEAQLLKDLARAESNVRDVDGGVVSARDVYVKDIAPAAIGADRIAVSLALSCALGAPAPTRVAAWKISTHDEVAIDDASVPCVVGQVSLVDTRVEKTEQRGFAVVGFGGVDWRGITFAAERTIEVRALLSATTDVSSLARALDVEIAAGARGFTLKDAPADLRDDVIGKALDRRLEVTDAVLAELLLAERAMLRGIVAQGGSLPPSTSALVGHALSWRAKRLVSELVVGEGTSAPLTRQLRTVVDDARGLGVVLDVDATVRDLEGAAAAAVVRAIFSCQEGDDVSELVERVRHLASVLGLIIGDRPHLRLLKASSSLQAAATRAPLADERASSLRALALSLLPTLDQVCGSAFSSALGPQRS